MSIGINWYEFEFSNVNRENLKLVCFNDKKLEDNGIIWVIRNLSVRNQKSLNQPLSKIFDSDSKHPSLGVV